MEREYTTTFESAAPTDYESESSHDFDKTVKDLSIKEIKQAPPKEAHSDTREEQVPGRVNPGASSFN